MNKHTRRESIMLTLALFAISGAILAYNLHTLGDGELAVSLYDLVNHRQNNSEVISTYTVANLTSKQSVFTGGVPELPPKQVKEAPPLAGPIITPPEK